MEIRIWAHVEMGACAKPHISFDKLKATVYKEWAAMYLDFMVKVCSTFYPMVQAKGDIDGYHFDT